MVGGAVLRDGRVLASRRTEPPRLAGLWEFPGGKVEPGESDAQALVRELSEELQVTVQVGERLGGDLLIGDTAVLRVYLCRLVSGEPALVDHDEHRWLGAQELLDVDLQLLLQLAAERGGVVLAWVDLAAGELPEAGQVRRLGAPAGEHAADAVGTGAQHRCADHLHLLHRGRLGRWEPRPRHCSTRRWPAGRSATCRPRGPRPAHGGSTSRRASTCGAPS